MLGKTGLTPDPDATWTVVLVLEGPSDCRRIPLLLDHWCQKQVDWVTKETIESFRRYQGLDPGSPYLKVKDIPNQVRELNLPALRGSFDGGDGPLLKKLVQVLQARGLRRADVVVVWGRDCDEQPERKEQAKNARQEAISSPGSRPRLVLLRAVADPCGEAWVIGGFVPNSREQELLDQERQRLGFDPTQAPHKLSHKEEPKTTVSAKAILERLLSWRGGEEAECLAIAAQRPDSSQAQTTGLSVFHEDVSAWLKTA